MSKLRDLMEELCPNGVEYKKLGEICVILDSHRRPVTKKDRVTGQYPYYGANGIQDYVDDFIFDGTFLLIGEDGSVLTEQGTPLVHWATGKIWVNNHAHILKEKGEILLRFLFHYMQTVKIHHLVKGVPPKLNQKNLREIPIPVPPLEIQNEIVKLLDNFTELTAELTEQLMTELTLRKKQYNFYRDNLLNFVRVDDTIVQTDRQTDRQAQRISKFGLLRKTFDVEWKALGEVAYYVRDRIETNNVPVDNYVGVENLLQDRAGRRVADSLPNVHTSIAFTHNDILIGNIRPYLKKIWMANCSGGTNGDVLTIRLNEGEKILHRYLYYTLSSNQFFHYDVTYSKGTKMPRGDKGAVMKYRIPIPPLEVQQKIVSILDRFDALCNDLTSGLLAEIAARKRQYEHYRDKLLTFPRING